MMDDVADPIVSCLGAPTWADFITTMRRSGRVGDSASMIARM
jgi:hypothetical protein